MRVVFFGTPEEAVPYLRSLAEEQQVLGVITQPDRPRGRGRQPVASPVKREAERLGLPVLQPRRIREESVSDWGPLREAEILVVVAYGQILPGSLCDSPERPAINVHYSLLPDLRGAAPVQRAILGGRQTTGVTVQYVAEELDSGDLILQQEVGIEPEEDAGALFAKLEQVGVPLLSTALRLIENGEAPRRPQEHERATYAPPLRASEAEVDWSRCAAEIVNQIRAFSPKPGAYSHYLDVRLKLFAPALSEKAWGEAQPGEIVAVERDGLVIRAGRGSVLIREVQPAGRKRMAAADWARGARLTCGARLTGGAAEQGRASSGACL